jgi:glycerol-3-phosphate O-acyltransferase/dihydroxyacetone phosphate acyltransferase
MLSESIARFFGWTAAVFFRVETVGGPLPDGPVLVTANHPNALLDPLLIFRTAGRAARPLAKAPLFEQVLVGSMLKALGGLPVYRKQDDPSQMHRNDETFRRAIDALQAGDAVQIFPEGRSHSEPGLVPLRTGAARIALAAEAERNWQLGLHIVPVGITYRRKALFRGRALVSMGQPFRITDLRSAYLADDQEAVRALTDRIGSEIQKLTLNLTESEDQELIETAEALYVREKGIATFRGREDLHTRMPRLQRFAHGLAWLRAHDPHRHERLRRLVRRYRTVARLLGAAEGDVPARYGFGSVLWYSVRESFYLLVGAPAAALGTVLWYPAYLAPRVVVRMMRPEYESIATFKLATGFFIFPILLALYIYIAWKIGGPAIALLAAVVLPLLGFIALAWRERWARVREDSVLFTRAVTRPRTTERLAAYRTQLVRMFESVDLEAQGTAEGEVDRD